MAFLYRPKPKKYDHKPIYYNPDEEKAKRWQEKKQKNRKKEESNIPCNDDYTGMYGYNCINSQDE